MNLLSPGALAADCDAVALDPPRPDACRHAPDCVGLGVAVGLGLLPLTVLSVAVFAGQVSIGLSNDVLDARRDRFVGRVDKPLAREGAPVRAAWIFAFVSASVALILSAAISWQLALAHLVFIGSGWIYNVWAKTTVWSALCFVLGFGVFPSLAPLGLPHPQLAPAWAGIAGVAFGVAIHFSNVLPDLDDDERTGVRGLPHRLGRRWSALVAAAALIVGAFSVATAPSDPVGPDDASLTSSFNEMMPWVGFVVVTAIALCGYVASVFRAPSKLSFQLVMLAALLLAVQIIFTGGFVN